MKTFLFIIVLFVSMILQAGNITNCISFGELYIKPDILLILMVYLATVSEPIAAVIISFILGMAADTIMLPPGPFMISYLLVGTVISNLKKMQLSDNAVFQGVLVFLACAAVLSLSELLKFITNHPVSSHLLTRIFATSFYSAVLTPFVWFFFDKVREITGLKRQR